MSENFKTWMAVATTAQIKALSAKTSLSRAFLYQLANGNRKASGCAAKAIEQAAKEIGSGLLPAVDRTDLMDVCRDCPYRCVNK